MSLITPSVTSAELWPGSITTSEKVLLKSLPISAVPYTFKKIVSRSESSGLTTVNVASLQPSTTVVSPKKTLAPSIDASATMSIAFDAKDPSSRITKDSSAPSDPSAIASLMW